MKQFVLGIAFMLACTFCFGKPMYRRDVYGNNTCTIYWDSEHRGGPDNTNWARNSGYGWRSVTCAAVLCKYNNNGQKEDYYIYLNESYDGQWSLHVMRVLGTFKEVITDLPGIYDYYMAREIYDETVEYYKLFL